MGITQEHQLLKTKALKALSQREHARQELQMKLSRYSANMDLINQVLDECEAHHWLDTQRFAIAYIEYRAKKYYGPKKIRYELEQRGVTNEVLGIAFAKALVDWEVVKSQALEKKFGKVLTKNWQEKAKHTQYLYQRGF